MNRKEIAIFLTLMVFYIYYQRPPFHAYRYLCLTHSIVDHGTLNMDYCHEETGDISFHNGHYYLAANPGLSFLAVPVYASVKFMVKIFPRFIKNSAAFNHFFINICINSILTCLMAIMFYRTLAYFGVRDEKKRIFLTLTLGLGTIIFVYSLEYFAASTVGTFFAFASFCLLLYPVNNPAYFAPPSIRLFLSGICCGMCLLIGYEYSFFIVIFGFYLLLRLKTRCLLPFAAGFIIVLIALMLYQKACFSGYLTAYNYYMASKKYTEHFHRGFMGFRSFSPDNFKEFIIGMRQGYFSYMPVMILSLLGVTIFLFKKLRKIGFMQVIPTLPGEAIREVIFAVALFSGYLFAFSSYPLWATGSTFGPRYFMVTIPFFLLLVSFVFEYMSWWIVGTLAGVSLLINWFGAQFEYNIKMNLLSYAILFIQNGPSSSFTRYLVGNVGLPAALVRSKTVAAVNLFFLCIIGVFLLWLWFKYANLTLDFKPKKSKRF